MLIMPAILESFRSLRDRTLKLTFETNEPTPEQLVAITHSLQKAGFVAFNPDVFQEKEKEFIASMKVDYDDTEKSKGQRLRAVFYKLWEQDNQGYDTFTLFYDGQMEKLIRHFKNKLA